MSLPSATFVLIVASVVSQTPAAEPAEVEKRAIAYLAVEVPRWFAENKCFSCHNQGDGARALYTATRLRRPVASTALAGTTSWLARPHDWKNNRGDPAFSDKTLATLQFAVSLAEAKQAGLVDDPAAFAEAARLVADAQQTDGSWKPDGPDVIGSPATWGRALSTAMARDALAKLALSSHRESLRRADIWLRKARVETVLDAAAVTISLGGSHDDSTFGPLAACLKIIIRGEAQSGGWGPHVNSPPEPFDTAVVLIALNRVNTGSTVPLIERGRNYLARTQMPDGSWPETTRPAESVSYAQRLSTAGWATQALLLTAAKKSP